MNYLEFIQKAEATPEGHKLLEDYKAAFKEWKVLFSMPNALPENLQAAGQKVKDCSILLWTISSFGSLTHDQYALLIQQLEKEVTESI